MVNRKTYNVGRSTLKKKRARKPSVKRERVKGARKVIKKAKKTFKKEIQLARELNTARSILVKKLIKEKTIPKEQAEKIAKKLVRPTDVREPKEEEQIQEQVRRRPAVSLDVEEQPKADYTSKPDTLEEAGGLEQKVAGAPEAKTETPEYRVVDDRVQDYVSGEEPEDRGEGLRAQIAKYLKSVDVEKAQMGSSGDRGAIGDEELIGMTKPRGEHFSESAKYILEDLGAKEADIISASRDFTDPLKIADYNKMEMQRKYKKLKVKTDVQ